MKKGLFWSKIVTLERKFIEAKIINIGNLENTSFHYETAWIIFFDL